MKHLGLREYLAVEISLIVIIFIFYMGGMIPAFFGGEPQAESSFRITDITLGTGAEAMPNSAVSVDYVLTLADGKKIDSSYDRGEPLPFTLGTGAVIAGFDKGVVGMKVGGKRRVVIPPDMGYGSRGVGPIPPDSILFFDVELVSVK